MIVVRIKENMFNDHLKESLFLNFNRLKNIITEIGGEVEKLNGSRQTLFGDGFDLSKEVKNFEIKLIGLALKLTNGNQTKAVRLLGIKKSTLNAKMKRYNIAAR